jgi:hypothetical protein
MTNHSSAGFEGVRQGCIPTIHSFPITSVLGIASGEIKLGTIPGTSKRPLCFRVFALVKAAYTNTDTATLSVGTTAGGTQILNAVDIKAAAGTTYAGASTNAFEYTETDVDLYAETDLANLDDETGALIVFVEIWDVNVKSVSAE